MASHHQVPWPAPWMEFQSTSTVNQRAPVAAMASSWRPRSASLSQRMAEPAAMPVRSAIVVPKPEDETPGGFADSAPGELTALSNGGGTSQAAKTSEMTIRPMIAVIVRRRRSMSDASH